LAEKSRNLSAQIHNAEFELDGDEYMFLFSTLKKELALKSGMAFSPPKKLSGIDADEKSIAV
jgi:hypothetical protein